ncbi:ACT domain-containing protein [Tateyamaria sp. ANG-S1]|uniref:ACT domain-containing protein n=1 Tax=Tateyamaria sp. ANG-S1 TaxID=1577905 RepID=UPI00057D58EC|nr:ACT domain-containing protein [Tateyamaria sp. ANG-S1]KIC51910.1 hypothetical protein RA29_01045 [Tateyamaria sp. ANG-S1]
MPVTDTQAMISGMTPALQPGRWVFCTMAEPVGLAEAFALIREAEGITMILPYDVAQAADQDVSVVMSLITLEVFSDLEGIGLTAAVSTALAGAGISCNVVAAYHHDHIFVGEADAERAVEVLKDLQKEASKS